MKKTLFAILCIAFLVCLAPAPATSQEMSISETGKNVLPPVPKAYGELKNIDGELMMGILLLTFEDKNGVIRLVQYNINKRRGALIIEVPRN